MFTKAEPKFWNNGFVVLLVLLLYARNGHVFGVLDCHLLSTVSVQVSLSCWLKHGCLIIWKWWAIGFSIFHIL